jgi:hypothetical protein
MTVMTMFMLPYDMVATIKMKILMTGMKMIMMTGTMIDNGDNNHKEQM